MTLRFRDTLALAAASALLALGCASRTPPPADYIHGPLPHQERRAPDYSHDTFWSHLSHEAYETLSQAPADRSEDQEMVVREFGPPTHRREFTSLMGEDVVEWLNIGQNQLFQFIGGALAYQGEIRDIEHTLIRWGRPNEVIYRHQDPEIDRVTFIYRPAYSVESTYFDFANGTLDYEEHHN
jgi:hypothetical protein